MSDAFIYEAVRTPFGRFGGALAGVRPDDLAAHALRALLERAAAASTRRDRRRHPRRRQRGRRGQPQRRADGGAARGPPDDRHRLRPSTGSAARASRRRSRRAGRSAAGDASLVVAGGVESMTRAPWVLLKPARAFPAGNETLHSTTLGWRMVNPRMAAQWTISLGAERREAGRASTASRARPRTSSRCAATSSPRRPRTTRACCGEVVPVPGVDLERDEGIRPDTSLEKLAAARAGVRRGRDGHRRQLLAAQRRREHGAARRRGGRRGCSGAIRSRDRRRGGATGVDPDVFGIAPVQAAEQGARARRHRLGRRRGGRAQRGVRLAVAGRHRRLAGARPRARSTRTAARSRSVTRWGVGGAYPRRLAHELRPPGGGYGVATLCIGVGQGLAVVLEA